MMNAWDERFSRTSNFLYGLEPNAWIKTALPRLNEGARVLALADGEGRNALWLASLGYRPINCDYSAVGLDKCRQQAEKLGLRVDTDCRDLTCCGDWLEPFDAVVSSFFHVDRVYQAEVWRKVINAMKPGACLVVQVFDESQLPLSSGGPKNSNLLYRLSDWEDILVGMQIETLVVDSVELNEGNLHQGAAKVINIKSFKQ